MEYPAVVFLHVLFGIIWAGGALSVGLFVLPAVIDAGPAGGAVMAGVLKRRFPVLMTVSASIVMLTGVRLYMVRFTTEWMGRPEGIVLTLGAILAIAGFGIGFFAQKPTAEKLARMGGQIAASGVAPTPAQITEMQALRGRLGKAARLTAWHLIAAASLMAIHRLAALL